LSITAKYEVFIFVSFLDFTKFIYYGQCKPLGYLMAKP